jgi:hypothetical protein
MNVSLRSVQLFRFDSEGDLLNFNLLTIITASEPFADRNLLFSGAAAEVGVVNPGTS